MSSSREDIVVCPGCGAPGPMTLLSKVDVTLDPALKERLLRGRLSVFTCAKCGREARIAHAVLYADPARGLFLQLVPEGPFDAPAALARLGAGTPRVSRLVRDGNALIEKVRIDDASLDDRVVEVEKLLLALSHEEYASCPWYFERVDEKGDLLFTIVTAKGPHATRRPRAEYDAVATDLQRRGGLAEAPPFAVIDRAFAHEQLARPETPAT